MGKSTSASTARAPRPEPVASHHASGVPLATTSTRLNAVVRALTWQLPRFQAVNSCGLDHDGLRAVGCPHT